MIFNNGFDAEMIKQLLLIFSASKSFYVITWYDMFALFVFFK